MLFLAKIFKSKFYGNYRKIVNLRTKHTVKKWLFSTANKYCGFNLVTREKLLNNQKYNVLKFNSEESIVATEPYGDSDNIPTSITSKIGVFTLKKPFVSEIINAELIGSTAAGFDKEGSLISETVSPNRLYKVLPARTLFFKKFFSKEVTQLDTACSLVNYYHRNYFHWIVDCVLRIEGLEFYQKQTGRKPVLIIDSDPPLWKIESLKLLGYQPDDCIHWRDSKIKVKRLIVPSFRREIYLISPTACYWLRQRILSNLPDDGKKFCFSSRIFVSRSKTVGRHIINENDVMAALAPLGFVSYRMEDLSFSDQVRLFSQAEIVVAAHGAALTNIIFSQNLIVIELFNEMVAPFYFFLAKSLGFHYGCFAAAPYESNQYADKFKAIIVDVVKLRTLVIKMISASVKASS